MPRIVYVSAHGVERVVEVPAGLSAMEGAVQNLVPGIDGDCGGVAACGTCHVQVDSAWIARTGAARPGIEQDMLSLASGRTDRSRLACQILSSVELDGLRLHLPEAQH